ncbi:MAG: hypothetical protein C5B52_14755 [Bacteroidetes bacterium]|nr:MAG: hypothetical protein C5B52_14755 [Bacteroidota bacterium]
MRNYIVCLMVLAAVACKNNSSSDGKSVRNSDSSFVVAGKINGIENDWIYLYRVERGDKLDSVRANQGSFEFKGNIAHPEFCLIGFTENGEKQFPYSFFLDNSNIKIEAKKDSLNSLQVTGSPTQDELKDYDSKTRDLQKRNKELERQYQLAMMNRDKLKIDSIFKAAGELQDEARQISIDYAKANRGSYVAIYQLNRNFSGDENPAIAQSAFDSLEPKIQQSFFGNNLKQSLDNARRTAIGTVAPEFALNDVNGKPVSLTSYKGKYTLVDFWASWCGPCRQENPEVVKAFRQFHPKGFEILGVSLDEEKDKWLVAIQKDGLNWTHVSDLKGWRSDVAALYGVQAIPMNFLLDKDGKIIAKGLRGEALAEKLAEVIK